MTAPMTAATAALAPHLAWVVSRAGIDDDTLAAVRAVDADAVADGAADPVRLITALRAAEEGPAACRVVACALPPREGVWWGWVSARHAGQLPGAPPMDPPLGAALDAAERWIAQPDEDNRRAAWAASEVAGMDTPAGSVAASVFFTGGSVAPDGIPPVPPPAGMHCIVVGAAVVMSAAADAEQFVPLLDAYIAHGMAIVEQLGGWDASIALARQHFDAQSELHDAAVGASKAGGTPPAPAPGA
jgi:hypothetical protein